VPITQLDCPECGAKLRSATGFEPGKKIRCPKCKEVVTVPGPEARVSKARPAPARDEDDEDDRPAARRKAAAVKPSRPRRDEDDEDDEDRDDDEDEAPRRRKKGKKKEAAGFFTPGRIAIYGGLLAAVIAGVIVLVIVLKKGDGDSGGQARKDDKPRDGAPRDGSPRDGGPKDGAPGDGGIAFDKVLHPGLVSHDGARAAVTKLVGKWSGSKGAKSIEVTYRGDGTFKQVITDKGQTFPFEGTWKLTAVGGNQGGTSRIDRKAAIGGGGDSIQAILDPIGKPAGTITHKDEFDDWALTKAP
jgi:hypothetical protein